MPDAFDPDLSQAPNTQGSATTYQVLARRHRPTSFADLIGQEAMVRTLRNAFATGRIAHAFLLTGIRGVGKTTTARILAKALNCLREDSPSDLGHEPCGTCDSCIAISRSRHIDVFEIDAASHTGVDNIRNLIENARQAPNWARYKIYIVDEVHMLSASAFNALLKTLEEPPPHVKFIFATTEPQKLPVTVLSRCQRFDLRRVDAATMIKHLANIAKQEDIEIEEAALAILVRAAEGSVRDGVSLLDQTNAHCAGRVAANAVREMLSIADRGRILDLFALVCGGDLQKALTDLREQVTGGAEAVSILEGLGETCHWLSMLRAAPDLVVDPGVSHQEAQRAQDLAKRLDSGTLVRFWQILEKSLAEIRLSPTPRMAADMTIIRLTHASTLPTPAQLAQMVLDEPETTQQPNETASAATPGHIMQRVKANPEVRHVLNVPFGSGNERASIADITPLTDR